MIVPEFWAEAKERVLYQGKSATYKRFGWSDESHQAAFENARERVLEAAGRASRGEKVRLVDHKVTYNGAEGLPIREQIVERHGDAVITRNTYGALCLNTPNVLFADIDVEEPSSFKLTVFLLALSLASGLVAYVLFEELWQVVVLGLVGLLFSGSLSKVIVRLITGGKAGALEKALQRVEHFSKMNPKWAIRVYRTPNGYRLLVVHQLFDPTDDSVFDFMSKVGSDKRYVQMCRNQKCFRARLSPKPWRIDFAHIQPRPGIWPIKEERMEERQQWIEKYEEASEDYAACRYEKTLGSKHKDLDCEWVRQIHDERCRARQNLPLA